MPSMRWRGRVASKSMRFTSSSAIRKSEFGKNRIKMSLMRPK